MPPRENRNAAWANLPRPMDHAIAFAIGAFLAMIIANGWPPDIGEERTWFAGGIGGLVVLFGLFVSSRRRRGNSPGA